MDIIQPFMLQGGLFRGSYIAADETVAEILKAHAYPSVVADVLTRTILLATALAGNLKYDGVFSLQIRGNGPISSVFVNVTHDHKVRAYAVFEEDRLPAGDGLTNAQLFGTGQLLFSVAQPGGEPYQGVVLLTEKDLVETVLAYFSQSEQIPTDIVLRVKNGQGRCLLVQQMPAKADVAPEKQADLWETVTVLANSVRDEELFDNALDAQTILFRLFHADELMVFPAQKPVFECPCYRGKMKEFLSRMMLAERAGLYQDGKIITVCQFCNTEYVFTREDFND